MLRYNGCCIKDPKTPTYNCLILIQMEPDQATKELIIDKKEQQKIQDDTEKAEKNIMNYCEKGLAPLVGGLDSMKQKMKEQEIRPG